MKRVMLLLVVVFLAGCTLPEDDEDTPAVFGACPHWIGGAPVQAALDFDGPEQIVVEATSNGTGDLTVPTEHKGRVLDMFLLGVNSTGPIEMRVHALRDNGPERLLIHHLDGGVWQASPFVVIDGSEEVQVYLADTAFGAQTAPASIRIQAQTEVEATAALGIQPFYRVCGIPLKDPVSAG